MNLPVWVPSNDWISRFQLFSGTLMLHPLPVGEHTVRFGGTFDAFAFTLDITYHITVAK